MTHPFDRHVWTVVAWITALFVALGLGGAGIYWGLVMPGAIVARFTGAIYVILGTAWLVAVCITWPLARAIPRGWDQRLSEMGPMALRQLRAQIDDLLGSVDEAAERIREVRE